MSEGVLVAVIMSSGTLLGLIIKVLADRRKERQYKYNPHPPGEAKTCEEHAKALSRIEEKVDRLSERIAKVEGRLNGAR